ncbi:MAG: bifunctional glutathionylspermidine amidase/synthase [Gammaproteobacteria bacterium]|nr:bifunctional glutathionylspermidine amidase/synthase [Gammaproteobacteria bacterium]
MDTETNNQPARFGDVLGHGPGGVPAYSSHYPSADKQEFPDRNSYRSYVDGVFMGYKWQCVELARRWLYQTRGYIFDDIAMAYDIFQLRAVRVVRDNKLLPLRSFRNGALRPPEPGCLLIWNEGGTFEITGHVAIVTEVLEDRIRIIEQNVEHEVWEEGCDFARELPLRRTEAGGYRVECTLDETEILGWVIQTDDDTHAEPIIEVDRRLFNLRTAFVAERGCAQQPWLDPRQPDEAAYLAMMGGHRLARDPRDQHRFLCLAETAARELKRATNELHAMFLHATNTVLQDDGLLRRFGIPEELWPRLHRSWDNRRNQMITGRFDFSVSERGIKLYEYNADSASCYMECGKVQGRWAEHFGCDLGRDPGEDLHEWLVDAWGASGVDGILHIMQDDDPEETYHALYMKSAIEAAGLRCKIIRGLADLRWHADGHVVDAEGIEILWVWKTWAWETALQQLRAELDLARRGRTVVRAASPRLADVLLRPEVMVFEPLWTLIPSNKAILPVLSMMYPNHPYLLEAQHEVTDSLRANGYVAKPLAGRSGSNIRIVAPGENVVTATGGRFEHQDLIYQELFPLPRLDGRSAQVCTFSVNGHYAGACVRVDDSSIISAQSDLLPLRIVADADLPRV